MSLDVSILKKLGSFTLEIELMTSGGTTALLGASGCGKSLTLQCISGIVRPDSGKIALNGRTLFDSAQGIDLPPQKRRVGYLFQNYALFPNMTVEGNIACGLNAERDKTARRSAVQGIIEKMGLRGLEKHRPSQLSGGQQQRAALARILVGEPELLLLDEPMSALDSHLRDRVLGELGRLLAEFGREALLVTHSRDEAYHLAQGLAILGGGRVVGAGPLREVFQNPGTRAGALLTGCKNIVPARKAGECMVEIPDWGILLDAARPVSECLCAIGIRAHAFSPERAQNAHPVRVVALVEEPFEWMVQFSYAGQVGEPIWWRVPKGGEIPAPQRLGVSPEDILLLYD